MKREREEQDANSRPAKRLRAPAGDRLSELSDELLVRILSFGSVSMMLTCQRVSKKIGRIAGDSELWKAAYYKQFVLPRASRIARIKNATDAGTSEHLCYSSRLSKWLDDGHLVKEGLQTNWKQQYRLRHNWAQGQCAVSEIVVAERAPEPPLLVMMQNSMIFTADSISGLRVWSTKNARDLIASADLVEPGCKTLRLPTSMAIDSSKRANQDQRVALGFDDGSFTIYGLRKEDGNLGAIFSHPRSSSGTVSALAYASPNLLTMTEDQIVSLYSFSEDVQSNDTIDSPKLLYSVRSYTAWPPVSLSVRTNSANVTAAIAYALPTYLSGWTVGIQEMRLSHSGELIESRLATAADEHFPPLSGNRSASSPSTCPSSPFLGGSRSSTLPSTPGQTNPTSLSYSHPYLLAAHPDNTLTLYLVESMPTALSVSHGTRLWGHTSSVSGVHVGMRGKAVSVSRLGDELRLWDLEGGMASSAMRKRSLNGELSVRVQPLKATDDADALDHAHTMQYTGLRSALEQRFDDTTVSQGWVGFDEQNVIVLREKGEGTQALVVYDFT